MFAPILAVATRRGRKCHLVGGHKLLGARCLLGVANNWVAQAVCREGGGDITDEGCNVASQEEEHRQSGKMVADWGINFFF